MKGESSDSLLSLSILTIGYSEDTRDSTEIFLFRAKPLSSLCNIIVECVIHLLLYEDRSKNAASEIENLYYQ